MIPFIRRTVFVAVLAWELSAAFPAFAGGPVLNCGSGVPVLWPAGGAKIPFNPDRGGLGPLDNAAAVAAVRRAFAVWADVPSATVSYVDAGPLPVDVDVTNYEPYLFPRDPDGLSAVVFDETGEIFDEIFGPDSGVLGVAGPEWFAADSLPCTFGTIEESVALFNGPAFANAVAARDVMVHEFGHYTGLAHSVVNGQNVGLGDPTGPAPFTFGNALPTDVETMYPFYFGPGSGAETLEKDDVAILSAFYPEPSFLGGTGTISGTILAPNGTTRLTGINVVARNLADPIRDAVSAISGDRAFDSSPTDPRAGAYGLHGLTPGAQYAVYVDGLQDGGFSTPPVHVPGPEEFFNGPDESVNPLIDDPSVFTPVTAVPASPATGTDILINRLLPGPIVLGNNGSAEIFPPFRIRFCGVDYDSFFVNANGQVSFGAGEPFGVGFARPQFLMNSPQIAGLYADLDPTTGGTVSFAETANDVTVRFENVPRSAPSGQGGANTFSIRMFPSPASTWTTTYGAVSATGGLAGFSCGRRVTSGFELPSPPTPVVPAEQRAAVFTRFDAAHDELSQRTFVFAGPRGFRDTFEGTDPQDTLRRNDTFDTATPIALPFQSVRGFSAIAPLGHDVDYYRFEGSAGDVVSIGTLPGNVLLGIRVGLFRRDPGGVPVLVAVGFPQVTVRLDRDGTYAAAVTTTGDTDFTGNGTDFGRYNLSVIRYRGDVLAIGAFGSNSVEVPFGFSFPFQGHLWSSVIVNGPGTLTFGAADDDPFSFLSLERFLGGPPRIAPRAGLSPSPTAVQLIAERTEDALTIHFVGVLDALTDRPNWFSTEMRKDGRVRVTYFGTDTLIGEGLVGITPGGGAADPGPSDLSQPRSWPATGTTYEQFFIDQHDVDLFFRTLSFKP